MIKIDDQITYLAEDKSLENYDLNCAANNMLRQRVVKLQRMLEDVDTKGHFVRYLIEGRVLKSYLTEDVTFVPMENGHETVTDLLYEYWGRIFLAGDS